MPRPVGAWTKDKLLILERYLPGYLQATSSALDRVYIDAFAGPGTNRVDGTGDIIDGSPLLALKARAANGSRFTKLILIDNDRDNVEELRNHIQELGEQERAEVLLGDVNELLPVVVRRLHTRAPTFVFLDTEGIEPRWTTIQSIAPWRVEFLINFPLGMSINRNPDSQRTLEYFGTEECLPLLAGRDTLRTRALLDLYKSRLAELGFVHTTEDDRLVKTLDNHRLYYLVFVSKAKPAQSIMNWVFKQPDSRGQARLDL